MRLFLLGEFLGELELVPILALEFVIFLQQELDGLLQLRHAPFQFPDAFLQVYFVVFRLDDPSFQCGDL